MFCLGCEVFGNLAIDLRDNNFLEKVKNVVVIRCLLFFFVDLFFYKFMWFS